jgi:hypothetical protein
LANVNQFWLALPGKRRYMKLSPGKLTQLLELAGRQPASGIEYWG